MSSKAKKILALILIAVVMGSFGFHLGQKLKYKIKNSPQTSENTIKQEAQPKKKQSNKLYKSNYEVIKPDIGPILQTLDVNVEYLGDKATFDLKANEASKLRINQQVILFDDEGYILPLGGKLTQITETGGGVTLPPETKTEFLNKKLTIITEEISNTKRLPLELFQTDQNKQTYIWAAIPEDKGFRINRQYIDISTSFKSDAFVEVNHKVSLSDLIVFNPDNKIKSNRLYEMTFIDLERPLLNPIRQAWLNYEKFRVEQFDKKRKEITDNCYKGIPNPDLTPNQGSASYNSDISVESCGQDFNQPRDPMDIFNEILNRGTGGGSACGASACGG